MNDIDYSAIRVLAVAADDTACGQYRVIRPLRYLQERYGVHTRVQFTLSPQDLVEFRPNILLLQRCISPGAIPMAEIAKKEGILVVHELDDNLHRVDPRSPAYQVYRGGSEALAVATRVVGLAHGCTFSTESLRRFYQFANRNAVVVPNSIDFDLRPWRVPFRYRQSDRLVVGWTFAAQHQQDYGVLKHVLSRIVKKYPHVDIAFYANPTQAMELFRDYGIPPERAMLVQPNRFQDYPYWIGIFDIGVAPLFNDEFTRAKSDLKLLEYGARGVPCVASDVEPYRRSVQQGTPALIADSDMQWEEHLCRLIEDRQYREDLGQRAEHYVYEQRNMRERCLDLVRAWMTIADNARAGITGPDPNAKVDRPPGRNDPCPCGSGRKYKKCCYPSYGR